MKAILVPYSVEQNAPSKPLKRIVELPDDIKKRDKLLKKLFREHVGDVPSGRLYVEEGNEDDYGDLIVVYGDDLFLYVTFVDES